LTIILNNAPYGSEEAWNAQRPSQALVSASMKKRVNVFLIGDALTIAKKRAEASGNYCNLEKMLTEVSGHGVRAVACRTCANARELQKQT
jgi:uncharacterized protein involved in oxidation of intracellular sulfur